LLGYAGTGIVAVVDAAAGLVLIGVGAALAAGRGGLWVRWIGAAATVWVMAAPHLLGYAHSGLAASEALWAGGFAMTLVVIAALERRLARGEGPLLTSGPGPTPA